MITVEDGVLGAKFTVRSFVPVEGGLIQAKHVYDANTPLALHPGSLPFAPTDPQKRLAAIRQQVVDNQAKMIHRALDYIEMHGMAAYREKAEIHPEELTHEH